MNGQPEEVESSRVEFLREQDGVPERELKRRLSDLFAERGGGGVRRAYLAIIRHHGQAPLSVALCLRVDGGPDRALVDSVGKVFASLFNERMFLDIVFVDEAQEVELARVCKPFVAAETAKKQN
jgi:hypothetical protein